MVKVKYKDGQLVEVEGSATEAAEFHASLNGFRPSKKHRQGTSSVRKGPKLPTLDTAFLRTILDAGQDGIPASEIVRMLELKSWRGIGGIVMALDTKLKAVGLDRNDVIPKKRVENQWIWYAGPKILEALNRGEK